MVRLRPFVPALCATALLAMMGTAHLSIDAVQNPPAAASSEEQQARVTCGGCHAFPPPDILPKSAWRDEFIRMMYIRENRLPPLGPPERVFRGITLPPDMEQVLPYYTSRAPERLPAIAPWPSEDESPVRFAHSAMTVPDMPATPAVSNVQ